MTEECAICLNTIKKNDNYKLPCGHQFHYSCIKAYVNYGYRKCCLCQQKFELFRHKVNRIIRSVMFITLILNVIITISIFILVDIGIRKIIILSMSIIWTSFCLLSIICTVAVAFID